MDKTDICAFVLKTLILGVIKKGQNPSKSAPQFIGLLSLNPPPIFTPF